MTCHGRNLPLACSACFAACSRPLQQARLSGSSFQIPFDRQELADFLEVDRSGLSAEIGKLRREGILECRRSQFTLLR